MASLISTVTSLITAVFGANGWVSSVVGAITAEGNEILLIGFILGIAGFAVGTVKRLTRLG